MRIVSTFVAAAWEDIRFGRPFLVRVLCRVRMREGKVEEQPPLLVAGSSPELRNCES